MYASTYTANLRVKAPFKNYIKYSQKKTEPVCNGCSKIK